MHADFDTGHWPFPVAAGVSPAIPSLACQAVALAKVGHSSLSELLQFSFFLLSFPATGKIQKYILRAQLACDRSTLSSPHCDRASRATSLWNRGWSRSRCQSGSCGTQSPPARPAPIAFSNASSACSSSPRMAKAHPALYRIASSSDASAIARAIHGLARSVSPTLARTPASKTQARASSGLRSRCLAARSSARSSARRASSRLLSFVNA
jgi:hypothetical protein